MHIDLGAGDGRYVLGRALREPETDFLGIEPNRPGLIEASLKAAKQAPNARYVLGALDDLPGPFAGTAEGVSILFPWGSLLRAVLSGEAADLARIAAVCRPGAEILVVTAIEAAADAGELARLGIDGLDFDRVAARWCASGLGDVSVERLPPDHPYQTTWWKKIRQRADRQPTVLRARAGGA